MPRPSHKVWDWECWELISEDYKRKHIKCLYCDQEYKHAQATRMAEHVKNCKTMPKVIKMKILGEAEEPSEKKQSKIEIAADEDSNSSLHQQDVYFEECDGQIKCTVCKKNISDDGEDPRSHLEEHHPGLLARIIKNEEKSEEANNEEAEKDVYTEFVYLDPIRNSKSTHKRLKYMEKSPLSSKKRRLSTPDHDLGTKLKKIEEKIDNPSELDSFMSYIKALLKKLPGNVCTKVQFDIINLIMKAQFQLPSTSNLASNSGQSHVANVSIVLDDNVQSS